MLLTDTDIAQMKCNDPQEWKNQKDDNPKLYIHPFLEACLTPVGYDLRVGSTYVSFASKGNKIDVNATSPVIIKPGDTALITTLEEIRMPKNNKFSALISSKVSKVSKGLSSLSTTIDPDWEGTLLITLHNNSQEVVKLKYEETFCTVVFFENKSASTKESNHNSGREDIIIERFHTDYQLLESERKKKKYRKFAIQVSSVTIIILSFLGIGYKYFNKDRGAFLAVIAIGVSLSQTGLMVVNHYFEKDED